MFDDTTFPNLTETYNKLKIHTRSNRQDEPARDLSKERVNGIDGDLPNNTFLKLFNKQTLFFNNTGAIKTPNHAAVGKPGNSGDESGQIFDFQEKF
jgi:hypothetical protein